MNARIKILSMILLTIFIVTGCSTTSFKKHKAASLHFVEAYEATAKDIKDLYDTSTEENKAIIESEISPVFYDVGDKIDLYIDTLLIWETFEKKPVDTDTLFNQIQTGFIRISELLFKIK